MVTVKEIRSGSVPPGSAVRVCSAQCLLDGEEGVDLLADQLGRLGTQDKSGAAQAVLEVGVGVTQYAFGGVCLDQRHQLGRERGPDLFSDVLAKLDQRCRAVPVEEVGDEYVVPVPGY